MITPADVLAGASSLWTGQGLNSSVGPLISGRAPAPQTHPYTKAACVQKRRQDYTEGFAGSPYVAWFSLTLTTYGVGEKATADLGKQVEAVFIQQGLTVAGGTLVSLLPEDDAGALEQDPSRKAGEDVWRFANKFEVCLKGTL